MMQPLARESNVPRLEFERLLESRRAQVKAELAPVWASRPPESPVVLEIGSGHGHFLTAYAARHPGHCCIGIDIMEDRIRRAIKKRARAGHPNLHFIRSEASEFLKCIPDTVRFSRIVVLFPDPWPKKRHHKNRLLGKPFLNSLAHCSQANAHLFFRTDHLPYFDEVQQTIQKHPHWEHKPALEWPLNEPTVFEIRAKSFKSLTISCLKP